MQQGTLFANNEYKDLEARIKDYLNSRDDYLTPSTAKSPRAVGDAIQELLSEHFHILLGPESCSKYSSEFARRAMADLAFEDPAGCYYRVDVKTHRLSTKFNMPNLTSVERLARFYEDEKSYFVILMVSYEVTEMKVEVEKVLFVPIEFLSWECLTIGALGWGQIQIRNSNDVRINHGCSRRSWMVELCDAMLEFYPKEVLKIDTRVRYFQEAKQRWIDRPE